MQNELKPTINKPVFLTSALFILLLVVFTIAAPATAQDFFNVIQAGSWATPAGSTS